METKETTMTDQRDDTPNLPAPRPWTSRRFVAAGAVALALALGVAGGAEGTRLVQRWHPQAVMLLTPVAVNAMKPDSAVAVKGKVAEIFGNKFVVQDDSGRALVDTGPRGEGRNPVMAGEDVTVQGHFDRGIVHAQLVMHADGQTDSFGGPPPHHPPHPPHGPKGPGPEAGPDALPPPAPAAPPAQ
jgi:hypothetical protein